MQKKAAQQILATVYSVYDQWMAGTSFACKKGCSSCCTRSVTLTGLEGELLIDHLQRTNKSEKLEQIKTAGRPIPAPAWTTNQFAGACLNETELPGEETAWCFEPCLFLEDGCCEIYEVRPFACRSFASRIPCDTQGTAELEPLSVTLNTVVLQILEQVEYMRGGIWGNMNHLLPYLWETNATRTGNSRADQGQGAEARGLLPARPLPGFLIPPEEQQAIGRFIEALVSATGLRLDNRTLAE